MISPDDLIDEAEKCVFFEEEIRKVIKRMKPSTAVGIAVFTRLLASSLVGFGRERKEFEHLYNTFIDKLQYDINIPYSQINSKDSNDIT